jgi:AraC-like DNA-binding protein
MHAMVDPDGASGLEGLCAPVRLRLAPAAAGLERLEARFAAGGFAPHRHDSYAIGLTRAGAQAFRYRGARHICLPGQCHVLHPDELHDGEAGTPAGFAYRIAYLDPALIQQALGGRPLPFLAAPVLALPAAARAALAPLWDIRASLDPLEQADAVAAVAELLAATAGAPAPPGRLDLGALGRVRARLAAEPARPLPLVALERLSGLDRWTLARQFRAAYGTSPSRFRTLRQLDRARALIAGGTALAEAALAAGFADQSHLTRQFKRAYGLTPGRWARALVRPGA